MAAVKSIEDHGYVMDLGKTALKAFLPAAKKSVNLNLSLGQVIPCVVTKVDGSAAVLSAGNKVLNSKIITDFENISVHTMCPGMSFETKVECNVKNGLRLKFGDFRGYVHISHQGQEDLEIGQETKATLLYVLPTLNHIYLSLQDDLIFNLKVANVTEKPTKIGELAKDCNLSLIHI